MQLEATCPCLLPADEVMRATYQEGTAESHQLRNCRVERVVLCETGGHLLAKGELYTFLNIL